MGDSTLPMYRNDSGRSLSIWRFRKFCINVSSDVDQNRTVGGLVECKL